MDAYATLNAHTQQVLLVYLHGYAYIITIVVKELKLRTWKDFWGGEVEEVGVGVVVIQLSTHMKF